MEDYVSPFAAEWKMIDQIKNYLTSLENKLDELTAIDSNSELQSIITEMRDYISSSKKEVYDMEWRLGFHRNEVSPYGKLSEENNQKSSQAFVDDWMRKERDGLEILVKKLKEYSVKNPTVQNKTIEIEKKVKKMNDVSLDLYFSLLDFVTHLPN